MLFYEIDNEDESYEENIMKTLSDGARHLGYIQDSISLESCFKNEKRKRRSEERMSNRFRMSYTRKKRDK